MKIARLSGCKNFVGEREKFIFDAFIGLYVTFGLWHEPSVCRLSVTLLHAMQKLELFGNILHCLIGQ